MISREEVLNLRDGLVRTTSNYINEFDKLKD
jgi:hypothetical protein